jgi:hypothetical protein
MSNATGFSVSQFRAKVVEPALGYLGLPGGEAAIRLVLGTAAHESGGFRYLAQEKGPALGPFQIEPATLDDLHQTYLIRRPDIAAKLNALLAQYPPRSAQLASNLIYSAAVCRVLYYRAPDPLPAADDVDGLAKYWKRFFNTDEGAGTVAEFVSDYRRYIDGVSS